MWALFGVGFFCLVFGCSGFFVVFFLTLYDEKAEKKDARSLKVNC